MGRKKHNLNYDQRDTFERIIAPALKILAVISILAVGLLVVFYK